MLTAKEVTPGKLVILIDARFVDSFWKHLERIGVEIHRGFEPKAGDAVHQLIAVGTMNEFSQWKASWTPEPA